MYDVLKHTFYLLTLPVPTGGGGGQADPPKGFSWITFDQNNLETSNYG